jgi:hypothetical protein
MLMLCIWDICDVRPNLFAPFLPGAVLEAIDLSSESSPARCSRLFGAISTPRESSRRLSCERCRWGKGGGG